MRSLESAIAGWKEFKCFSSLDELRQASRREGSASVANLGLRSACWKALLVFDSLETSTWAHTMASSRSAYNALRDHFLVGAAGLEDDDVEAPKDDSLTALRVEIQQDVDRCMPDNLYYRQPETQRRLVDILFVYCRLNPDLGYRQGMHELAAPVLWAVERDAVDLGPTSKTMGEDAVVRAVFDAEHIEHDAFSLFAQIMQNAKGFYEHSAQPGVENPIVYRSQRIFLELLPLVDPELARHLHRADIVPQVFLLRWIRLLFGREFAFDHVLAMWDVLFAQDLTLEAVDYICVAMLLRIRWQLLESDHNNILTLLLHYPQPGKDYTPRSFVCDALYLKDHLDFEGSSYFVLKYTGHALQPADRPHTPPALPRNVTTFSGANTNLSPSRQTRRFESMLHSTAKNLYSRGERLGIGKAVRGAVDEVHRKAVEIRNAQSAAASDEQRNFQADIQRLEERNKQLSGMLMDATEGLWDYQKNVAALTKEQQLPNTLDIENLSVAIAKVQFVQVYLGDASLPLDEVDIEKIDDRTTATGNTIDESGTHDAVPEEDQDGEQMAPRQSAMEPFTNTAAHAVEMAKSRDIRPNLTEGKYSWMLGQEEEDTLKPSARTSFLSASESEPGLAELPQSEVQPSIVTPSPSSKPKGRPKRAAMVSTTDEDIFDVDSVRKGINASPIG